MDVINKLYSSVSSTVSQLSGVLPGNPVTREFDATEHIASAGTGSLWKIYSGYKKSTKQEASIFVFEKKQLEKWSKEDREGMVEILKRGITQLTKLRHPQILTVQHPLEESRESLAFATEPVFASLSNILGNTTNMPQPVPSNMTSYKLLDIEIKYGLIQLGEGLSFLHSDVKLLHKNICPESIIINREGVWKIFGFDFCTMNQRLNDPHPQWPFQEYNSSLNSSAQPSLDYMAPEHVLNYSHSPASDIYSMGVLIFTLYSEGGRPFKTFGRDYSSFKRFAKDLSQKKYPNLLCLPVSLVEYVKLMLNSSPEIRPDIHQFTKINFFDDIGVKTLSYLDSLYQWDNLHKSKFYKELPQIIQTLPLRINMYRILPCLVKEFVNPQMIPFVLPIVFMIAGKCTNKEYEKYVLIHLKPIMKIQEPVQILLIFMQNIELLFKMTPAEDVKTDVLPMIYKALESNTQQIQELCLVVLPTFSSHIDYSAMKNALLPRIKKLCINSGLTSVRVNCLLCIGKLIEQLDKWIVLDEIIPFLPEIPSREPAVLMAIVGIYKLSLTNDKLGITKEVMATNVIPFLMPLCIENSLSLSQFNTLVSLVKFMVNRVEGEHKTKLEQLNEIRNETKSFLDNSKVTTNNKQIDYIFSDLELLPDTSKTVKRKDSINTDIFNNLPVACRQEKQRPQQLDLKDVNQYKPSAISISNMTTQIPEAPKDLTSSMIQENLNQMKSPPNTSNSYNNITNNWQSYHGPNSTSNLSNHSWSTFPKSYTHWEKDPKSDNMNDFKCLLTNKLKKDNTPLNQLVSSNMGATLQPLLQTNNNNHNNNNHTKNNILSTEDILDFLK